MARLLNANCSAELDALLPALGLTLPEMVWLLIGIPSTTNKGWLSAPGSRELAPRITIRDEAPAPPAEIISTPATLPCMALTISVLPLLIISSLLTSCTA